MPAGAERTVAIDTSVAIPLLLEDHDAHRNAVEWRGGRPLVLCGHAWIETYSVITRIREPLRVTPEDAALLLDADFGPPLAPRPETLRAAVERFVQAGIFGGASYDGWVALTAIEHNAVLASRDARAEVTYRRLGVDLEMVPSP